MKAVRIHQWGGPEVFSVQDVPEPHPGPGQVRVHVTATSLNPVDVMSVASAEVGGMFGMSLPTGIANDIAGVVDEVGEGVTGFTVGDRVFGGARTRGGDEFAVVTPPAAGTPRGLHGDELYHTPEGLDDTVASTVQTAGLTGDAAVAAVSPGPQDTVLIGGAAGGVGVYAAQLARRAGARVLGTASESTFGFLRDLGVEPVAYGEGLIDRVRQAAPGGITAAIDLYGTETAEVALELGIPGDRISAVAAREPSVTDRITVTGSLQAPADSSTRLAGLLADGELRVPLAAVYPVEDIRDAAAAIPGRHTHGKIVVTF